MSTIAKERIPFGKEVHREILSNSCPGCEVNLGKRHEYGCPLESCPGCGGLLLKCSTCAVLSFHDEYRTTKAVSEVMDLDWVRRLLKTSPFLEGGLEENGALMWLIENQPFELQQELDVIAERAVRDWEKYGLGSEPELEVENLYPGWDLQIEQEQLN
ncbi:MAG: hypothetical protein WBB19_19950 [Desulforhopalus sp.]